MFKGTVVERIEATSKAAGDRIEERIMDLRAIMGDRPAFEEKLDDDEIARRHLPIWYVLGQAEDAVAVPFWQAVLELHGPKETARFDLKMRELHADPRYWEYATTMAGPELGQTYLSLRERGLHHGSVGEPMQPKGAKRRALRQEQPEMEIPYDLQS